MKTTRTSSSEGLACREIKCHAWARVTYGENQVRNAEDHCTGEHKCLDRRHVSSELIAIALLLTLTLCRLDADFLVILFESRQVLARLGELTLFHAFTNVPVDKCTLRVHKVKLVINAREDLRNRSGIADHATRTHHLGQVAAWNHGRRLIIDATLEAGRAPIHKLNCALCFDRGNRCVHILGYHIATVHHATSHVFSVAWVALNKHRRGLKD